MKKIYELKNALENIGINCELVTDAAWYCIDGKTHYGIELITDIDDGYDCVSFNFTPQGEYITNCCLAPTKE